MAQTPNQRPQFYPKMERPAKRPKEMKVLALGLSRTGTMSLYFAFKQLGYNPYHMRECGLDAANDSLVIWHQAIDAKYRDQGKKFSGKDFDQMLWRYDAVTDIPCALFTEELMGAYPDAQIILTHRPVDGWVRSIENSFYEILSWRRWSFLALVDRQFAYHYIPLLNSALQIWTGKQKDKSKLPAAFASHNERVRKAAKARGRPVLEFQVKDGWEPLCGFLGKEVPKEPFPKVNEGTWVVSLHYIIFYRRVVIVLLGFLWNLAPLAVVGLAWWASVRYLGQREVVG